MRFENKEINRIIKIIEPKTIDTIVFTFAGARLINTRIFVMILPMINNNKKIGMNLKPGLGFPPIIFFISSKYYIIPLFIIIVDIFPKQSKKNTKTKIGL
jgi:hypothetical protein